MVMVMSDRVVWMMVTSTILHSPRVYIREEEEGRIRPGSGFWREAVVLLCTNKPMAHGTYQKDRYRLLRKAVCNM
jgi:hypothetical protein